MKCIFRITACQQETPGVPRLKQTRSCSPSVSHSVWGLITLIRVENVFIFTSYLAGFRSASFPLLLNCGTFSTLQVVSLFSLPLDLILLYPRFLDDILHVLPLTGDVLHRYQPRPVRLHQQQSPPRDHDDCQGDPGHRQHSHPGQLFSLSLISIF